MRLQLQQQVMTLLHDNPQLHALLVIATHQLRTPPNLPINDKTKRIQNKNINNQLGDNAAL